MERWCGKVAVVTGASTGIGRYVAKELVKNGMKVAGLARRVESVEELSQEVKDLKGSLNAVKCDVTNVEDIKSAFEWTEKILGPVSVLVNNAGVYSLQPLNRDVATTMKQIVETNILGLSNCTSKAIASMNNNGIHDGHIININSILGHQIPPFQGTGIYTASKHAVTTLSEALRIDLAYDNSHIKVTSISPGLVETVMGKEFVKGLKFQFPMLHKKDIADCVVFALSTPPHVEVTELTVRPVGEVFGRSY